MRLVIVLAVAAGVLLNVIPAFAVRLFNIPLYVDNMGTMTVSAMCCTFPGMVVAVLTNTIINIFNKIGIYFSILSVMIAILSAFAMSRGWFKKPGKIALYIFYSALISGVGGALIQWMIIGGPQYKTISDAVGTIADNTGLPAFPIFLVINFGLNLVDKSITTLLGLVILKLIPEDLKHAAWNNGWKQKPLTNEELDDINKRTGKRTKRLQTKIILLLATAFLAIIFVLGVASIRMYSSDNRKNRTAQAEQAARYVASVVDGDMIDTYLLKGGELESYKDTLNLLYLYRNSSDNIGDLYVYKITDKGCYCIFDTYYEEDESYGVGSFLEYESFPGAERLASSNGEKVDPIVVSSVYEVNITAFEPIYDSNGICVAYAGADSTLQYYSEFVKNYILKTVLLSSGFLVLIMGYGLWVSGSYLVYPINSMAVCASGFSESGEDQKSLDREVKRLKGLDIKTDDEIEHLYKVICEMTEDTAEKVRDVRHYTTAVTQMQRGLIITMADLVENRDSDTGSHVQKTAAYVKIILDGLKRKGYYAEKLTPKYMSDVEMSAPLHDVGKINISDTILNKPGKLTDEEFEIMKTHTIHGKEIMERAISTVQGESYLKEARNMAAYHHEKWDGTGYPEGLHGEVIPLSARIMAVADVFDALVSKRVYKPAMPFDKAVGIIMKDSGKHFDPKCVEVFMDSLDEVKRVMRKYDNMQI